MAKILKVKKLSLKSSHTFVRSRHYIEGITIHTQYAYEIIIEIMEM